MPAGTCWWPPRANSNPRPSRSGQSCSTPGRSSSTTSGTRARYPTSTPPIWTAASRSPPDCSNSPTASSPPSGSACAATMRRPTSPTMSPTPASATPVLATYPGQPVPRRRLVAHRPLRLDLGAAPRARHHLARRARRACSTRVDGDAINRRWATATRPVPCAGWTTYCSRSSVSAIWACTATRIDEICCSTGWNGFPSTSP